MKKDPEAGRTRRIVGARLEPRASKKELISSRRVNVRNCKEFHGGGESGIASSPSFGIYPNPANDRITIIIKDNESGFQLNGNVDNYNDHLIGSNFGVMESDGDVAGVLYTNNLSVKGFMNITFVDSINNIVGGSFDVVKFDRLVPEDASYPEQVSFRNGTFRMKIID